MDKTLKYLDSIFKYGLLDSGLTIITMLITVLIINRFLNIFIKKRWKDSFLMPMRVKKVVMGTIVLTTIFFQIKSLNSLATTLLASGGIFAVVIGLASQEAASSMINGILIVSYKPYVINDTISIPDRNVRGKVLDITLRHTVLETSEKTQLIIPNTIMNQSMIENVSNIPNKKANYLLLTIRYDSDLEQAIQIIQNLASKHPFCIDVRSSKEKKQKLPKVPIHCVEFQENGVSLKATIYSRDNTKGFEMLSDLRREIVKTFEENAIVIPSSHTVVISNP